MFPSRSLLMFVLVKACASFKVSIFSFLSCFGSVLVTLINVKTNTLGLLLLIIVYIKYINDFNDGLSGGNLI